MRSFFMIGKSVSSGISLGSVKGSVKITAKSIAKSMVTSIAALGLVACSVSSTPQPVFQNTSEATHLFELELQAGDTIESLSNEYQAEVIIWEPEENIAILASSQEVGSDFLPQSLALDVNQDAVQISVGAQGVSGWASGASGWANGTSGWATGSSGWASGNSGWASGDNGWMVGHNGWGLGVNTAYLSDNRTLWSQIGLFDAHKVSEDLGYGKTIAVIDTGIDLEHPMLKDSLVDSSKWLDLVDNDNVPQDASSGAGAGHGTAVAGIILQVAPQAKILPIRVLDSDGQGDLADIINGINYARKQGVDIINVSIGSYSNSRSLRRVLRWTKNNGIYVVASAGNTGQENDLLYPAKSNTVGLFSVGSTNKWKRISDFSASGNDVFAYAPGENIQTAYPDNRLISVSGTSFAAPVLAGSLALAHDDLQKFSISDVKNRFKNFLNKDTLELAFDMDSTNETTWNYGNGILNVGTLLHMSSIDNPDFEDGLTGWRTKNASIVKHHTETAAKITASGYLEQTITGLQPNSVYELRIRLDFQDREQRSTIGIYTSGTGNNTDSLRRLSFDTRNYVVVSVPMQTDANDTSATIKINNPSSNDALFISNLQLDIYTGR